MNWRDSFGRWNIVDSGDASGLWRGRLLGLFILGGGVLLIPLTVVYLIQLARSFSVETAVMLGGNGLLAGFLLLSWLLNRRARTLLAGWVLFGGLTLVISATFPIQTLDRVVLTYTISILAASFLISPPSSFLFASLAVLGYSIHYFLGDPAFPYNYQNMTSLFVVALVAWLAARQLETALAQSQQQAQALKERNTQVQLHLERLNALRNIDLTILADIPLRAKLDQILELVAGVLSVDAACLLLLSPDEKTLEVVALSGIPEDSVITRSLQINADDQTGSAFLQRKGVYFPHLDEDGRQSPLHGRFRQNFAAYAVVPLVAKDQCRGLLEVFCAHPAASDAEWRSFLESLGIQTAIALDNADMLFKMRLANLELTAAYEATIQGWSHALELRDRETQGHSDRVTALTLRLAREMGISSQEELDQIRRGVLLHDIGKMGIPDSILLKPGPLSEEEWEIMRQHPQYAYDLLVGFPYLRPILDIPYCHHERWDGSGYPHGLEGEEIPLAARIFAIVDVWDALTSDRPYREAWPRQKVIAYLRQMAGTQFDPQVVDVFLRILPEADSIKGCHDMESSPR